jgi:hypothetical protein
MRRVVFNVKNVTRVTTDAAAMAATARFNLVPLFTNHYDGAVADL